MSGVGLWRAAPRSRPPRHTRPHKSSSKAPAGARTSRSAPSKRELKQLVSVRSVPRSCRRRAGRGEAAGRAAGERAPQASAFTRCALAASQPSQGPAQPSGRQLSQAQHQRSAAPRPAHLRAARVGARKLAAHQLGAAEVAALRGGRGASRRGRRRRSTSGHSRRCLTDHTLSRPQRKPSCPHPSSTACPLQPPSSQHYPTPLSPPSLRRSTRLHLHAAEHLAAEVEVCEVAAADVCRVRQRESEPFGVTIQRCDHSVSMQCGRSASS